MEGDSVDRFLRNSGMSDKEEQTQTSKWLDIIRPATVSVILGKKGAGKSGLAYYLAEEASEEYRLLPVVVNLPESKRRLLPDNFVIKPLSEVRRLENSVIIIDEGTTMLPAGQRKLEEMIKGFVALSRQRNQLVLFIFHSSSDAGSRILRGIDVVLVKEPSRRQIQFGSKDSWFGALLAEAKDKFNTIKQMGGDRRGYTFVDSEEPDFRGLMPNGLPSFWSEELSKAWANVDTSELSICRNCNRTANNLITGLCPVCYRNTLDARLAEKLDRESYKRALRRGEISLPQMNDDVLGQDPLN